MAVHLKDGERAALQCSGGKDSTALLHLAAPYGDRITVYFADTGAVFPHVREHVLESCRRLRLRLEVVLPSRPVAHHIDAVGLPSDIVPVEATLEMQGYLGRRAPQLVQSYMRCCSANIFEPLEQAIRRDGHTVVLRGSKRRDTRVGVGPSHWENGIEYRSPLWEWTDNDVIDYLQRNAISLPHHYRDVPDSLDCWLCTAHLAHHGEAKLRWLRQHYPHLWPELRARLAALKETIEVNRGRIWDALSMGDDE